MQTLWKPIPGVPDHPRTPAVYFENTTERDGWRIPPPRRPTLDVYAFLTSDAAPNVTAFFRDPTAWESYASDVIPTLLEAVGPDDPIRVWSTGCASALR